MTETPFLTGGSYLAGAIVAIFVLWALAKSLQAAQALRDRHPWGEALIDAVVVPAAAYSVGWLLQRVLEALGATDGLDVARAGTELLLHLALAYGFARLVEAWLVSQNMDRGDRTLTRLVRSLLYGIAVFLGLLIFLVRNDLVPTELFVSTGALAAILAFAMQQTLGDLFSGIALSIERPFKVGDWLRFSDGTEGQVTDINWRATRLCGWDNTTYVVPNGQLARQSFTNLHGPEHRFAPWYLVRVSGETDPTRVVALLKDTALRCGSVLRHPAPVARLMDAETIPYTYMVWVQFPNYPAMFAGREELYREIHHTLREEGLGIAAEIREVRHRPVDGQAAAPAARG